VRQFSFSPRSLNNQSDLGTWKDKIDCRPIAQC